VNQQKKQELEIGTYYFEISKIFLIIYIRKVLDYNNLFIKRCKESLRCLSSA